MSPVHAASGSTLRTSLLQRWLPIASVVFGLIVAVAAGLKLGSGFGTILFAGVVALMLGLWAASSPVNATVLLIVSMFLALPLRTLVHLPTDSYKIVLALLLVVTALWLNRTADRLHGIGAVEWAMTLYVMWNVFSMLSTHEYPAGPQVAIGRVSGLAFSVPSFIGFGIVVPFVCYAVGRYTFDRKKAVRAGLWTILALAAYSAAMSILPFTGPAEWVWPQYILHDPNWGGRAVGVLAQPLENGMLLVLGLAIALVLASQQSEPPLLRLLAFMVAPACLYGIYLTHTRMVWLCMALVLVVGAALAKGFRKWFIAMLGLLATMVIVNWSVFTSTNREAGGVASVNEIQHRLNIDQTAVWAATQKPIAGWGIGRFYAVNTYHHQLWSPNFPWIEGYADSAHQHELGILAELGLIGLALWLCIVALIAHRLWRAYRTLPEHGLCGKPLVVIAIMAFGVLLCTGLSSDLRFFGFPLSAIFLVIGITVGWSDRHTQGQPTSRAGITEDVDFAEPAQGQHA